MNSDDSQMPHEESSEDAPTPPEDYFDTPENHQKAVDMQRGREAGRNTAGGMRRDRDVSASSPCQCDVGGEEIHAGRIQIGEVTVGGQKVEATAAQVPGKMVEFVEWLNAQDAQTNDVATFAATAHYKMAKIHPFLNGNGRTCRLLMNFTAVLIMNVLTLVLVTDYCFK
ncbi:hypothetical protein niasHT_023435 [Heterodera trifolii]|uniref:Fido domain-containing protein n=1 Tax=Heterodera trifolii TaxID=157864 RepID=A0ABD2K414_9BILA